MDVYVKEFNEFLERGLNFSFHHSLHKWHSSYAHNRAICLRIAIVNIAIQ